MASRNIVLPVQPEVTLKVISRSNIDIILKIQHFERRIERADPMTFKVILKVTGVNFPVQADVNFKVICRSNVDIILKIQHFQRRN